MNAGHAHIHRAVAHHLGPRVPESNPFGHMDSIMNVALPNQIEARAAASSTLSDTSSATTEASSATSCAADDTTGACERSTSSENFSLPIILGVTIPLVGALVLFLILHRRHVRKQRLEDNDNRHASLDFGLGNVQPGRIKRKGPAGAGEEKLGRSRQLSMDMDINSPYILPPQLHGSRESLRSMSRNLHENEDPYRPVIQYYGGDGSSIRSGNPNKEGSSIYTSSSKAPSRLQEFGTSTTLLTNAGGMPQSNPPGFRPTRQGSLPQKYPAINSAPVNEGTPPPPYPVAPAEAHIPGTHPRPVSFAAPVQTLAPAPANSNGNSYVSSGDAGMSFSNNYLGSFIDARAPTLEQASSPPTQALPLTPRMPPHANSLPSNPRPARKEVSAVGQEPVARESRTLMDDESDYGGGFQVTPPSPKQNEMMRAQRYSMDVPPEEFVQAGLGAPGFDAKRLSMNFRPLPPSGVTEVEDPEMRANRIRSFYKEYFDESKPAPKGQYYEDYDETYLGDNNGYYDPNQNTFVQPYAEPIGRRAMTPPPRGTPRFQGQEPPRGRHGSFGAQSTSGMSTGGMRGPGGPQMYPPGPYPQGPKAYSSASGRGGPRRPMAPPAALSTVPTPSKLKDDNFAIFNAMDFAPPPTYRDRVQGRSESPLGERRAYSPSIASFNPTVSAFDELAPVPSPHVLRKSGTFTGLDFAPPKKFRDPDSMSDAGSIRSNRSGISQIQLGALRNGAGRVSRLPEDMVFTKDDLSTSLKPQWGMRAGS
ncbi:hypothetical protein BJ878DRAFT_95905 [Calycina marina]|uniref:Uncharacterized protein n=1 Tax=Calycina marina TaxID=1763456 RepID=A0A9P7Z2K8_9HELO|nr:hypothetical protein BJ878DRAFT_95905 [Calycina marina]